MSSESLWNNFTDSHGQQHADKNRPAGSYGQQFAGRGMKIRAHKGMYHIDNNRDCTSKDVQSFFHLIRNSFGFLAA